MRPAPEGQHHNRITNIKTNKPRRGEIKNIAPMELNRFEHSKIL